ncbi:MAG: alkaline phosphatase PhoX [Planctomycetota bacterium]
MNHTTRFILTAAVAAASLSAQEAFPIDASAGSTTAAANTAPFVIPARMTQTLITDRNTLTNSQGLPASFGLWDMVAFSADSRYIFVPSEVGIAAGVFRYDTVTGTKATMLVGNGSGIRESNPLAWSATNDEYQRLDPCSLSPWGTILTGEETTGGRIFECTNPLANGGFTWRWLDSVPAMAHEGVRFDAAGNMYVVDEDNSGCVYKFVPTVPGDLTVGQTFVLSVDGYAADPDARANENWNSAQNLLTTRTGPATWVPMTDAVGNALTVADPFAYVSTTGGRTAADELVGTPYGRPEDVDFNTLANGHEALYFTATSENAVYCVELTGATTAAVRILCDRNTLNLASGAAIGTQLTSPDNLAVDAWGSIYVIEDQEPGDIFKVIDNNKDGVAEGMGRLASLGVGGAEPTGMIFDPNDPYRFICCIQHPTSGNDALWSFDTRPYDGSDLDLTLASGINAVATAGPGEFVRDARGFDTVVFKVDSPNGALYGAPFALMIQPFFTAVGQPRFLPPLWLNLFQPSFALVGGFAGQFPTVLPFGPASVAVVVPPGLAGISVMTQALGIDASGAIFATDGVEIVLH